MEYEGFPSAEGSLLSCGCGAGDGNRPDRVVSSATWGANADMTDAIGQIGSIGRVEWLCFIHPNKERKQNE